MTFDHLADHDKRLALLENQVQQLTPRIEMMEEVAPLRSQIDRLEATVGHIAEAIKQGAVNTQVEIAKLAEQLTVGMKRLNDINEENMKKAAVQVDEKHRSDMDTAKSENEKLKQDNETKRLWNQCYRWSDLVIKIGGAAAILGYVLHYLKIIP